MIERRHEPRTKLDLALQVWGIDGKGEQFLQEAHARDISLSGAMLSGIDLHLRPGDVIGVLYEGKSARYRVVWVRYDAAGEKMQVAVHRIAADACPWLDLLAREEVPQSAAATSAKI